jgi:hypothetical protein
VFLESAVPESPIVRLLVLLFVPYEEVNTHDKKLTDPIYEMSSNKQVHSLNLALTRLTGGEYLGMFVVDKKRKRLLAYNKAAAGIFESFEFISDVRGLKKTCEKSEIWDMPNNLVKVTVKTLENNRWRIRKKSFPDDGYDFNKMAAPGRCAFLNQ